MNKQSYILFAFSRSSQGPFILLVNSGHTAVFGLVHLNIFVDSVDFPASLLLLTSDRGRKGILL